MGKQSAAWGRHGESDRHNGRGPFEMRIDAGRSSTKVWRQGDDDVEHT